VPSRDTRSRLGGYGIILLSSLLFGSYGVWSRLMGASFQPFYQAWVRSAIILLLMLPFMVIGKSFRKPAKDDLRKIGVYILFCVFTQVPLYFAFNNAPIGTVQLIFYSVFVITVFLVGSKYLGERITRVKITSLALAFVGLLIIFGVSAISFAPLGLFLAALNGVASGGEVATSKKIPDHYPPALIAFWGWVFTLGIHLPISLLIGERQPLPTLSSAWLWLILYSIVNAAAFWLVITGFRRVDASIGSLIGLMEVVFAVVFGSIIFHEALTLDVLIGGVLIISAAMLPDLYDLSQKRRD